VARFHSSPPSFVNAVYSDRVTSLGLRLFFTNLLFQCSTAVVQLTVNQLVVGSIPATGAKFYPSVAQSG